MGWAAGGDSGQHVHQSVNPWFCMPQLARYLLVAALFISTIFTILSAKKKPLYRLSCICYHFDHFACASYSSAHWGRAFPSKVCCENTLVCYDNTPYLYIGVPNQAKPLFFEMFEATVGFNRTWVWRTYRLGGLIGLADPQPADRPAESPAGVLAGPGLVSSPPPLFLLKMSSELQHRLV